MPPPTTIFFKLFLIALPLLSILLYADIDFSSWPCELLKALLIAFVASLITKYSGRYIFGKLGEDNSDQVYGLEHGRLNLKLPAKSMWMNIGFWKDTKDFPTACSNLLHEVLKTANIPPLSQIRLLDLGFGCGDQTLELLRLGMKSGYENRHPLFSEEGTEKKRPFISSYTGITLNKIQHHHAITRLANCEVDLSRAQLFQNDAANPGSWDDPSLLAQITAMKTTDPTTEESKAVTPKNWVLALDTLYHFSPSRFPILTYAHNDLNASVMTFDLLLSDTATLSQRLILSLLAKLMSCPMNSIMREREYRRMLREAGYMLGNVEMRDVSEYCFTPLAEFLDRRERELKGIGWGLGKFMAAKWMFGWWGRSGVVRGMIIVARR